MRDSVASMTDVGSASITSISSYMEYNVNISANANAKSVEGTVQDWCNRSRNCSL